MNAANSQLVGINPGYNGGWLTKPSHQAVLQHCTLRSRVVRKKDTLSFLQASFFLPKERGEASEQLRCSSRAPLCLPSTKLRFVLTIEMLRISILQLRWSGTSFAGLIGLLRSPVQGGLRPPTKKERDATHLQRKKAFFLSLTQQSSALHLAWLCQALRHGRYKTHIGPDLVGTQLMMLASQPLKIDGG